MASVGRLAPTAPAEAPRSLREFSRRFGNEEACEEFLFAVRYPGGFCCPRCGQERGWPLRGKRLIECAAGHKISLTAGTVLHRTRQDLVTWFHAAYLVSTLTPGISALQFQRQLGLSRYETAFHMLHKLRSALVAPDREPLHGEVEVDECLIGGRDPDRDGWTGDKAIVLCAVEVLRQSSGSAQRSRSRCGRVRLQVVPDRAQSRVVRFVQDTVAPGSAVHTDGSWAYAPLQRLGYQHWRDIQGKGRAAKYPLTHLDRVVSNLKAWLLGTHHGAVRPKHLQAYLNEFTFRFNRRFWHGPAFLRALGLAARNQRGPTYESLHRAGTGAWAHPTG